MHPFGSHSQVSSHGQLFMTMMRQLRQATLQRTTLFSSQFWRLDVQTACHGLMSPAARHSGRSRVAASP
jgi:hypothetical protein